MVMQLVVLEGALVVALDDQVPSGVTAQSCRGTDIGMLATRLEHKQDITNV